MAYIFNNNLLEIITFIVSFIIYAILTLIYFIKYLQKIEDYSNKKFKKIDSESLGTNWNFKWFIEYHRRTHQLQEELDDYKQNLKYAKLTSLISVASLGTDLVFTYFPPILKYAGNTTIIKYIFLGSTIVFVGYFYDILYSHWKMNKLK